MLPHHWEPCIAWLATSKIIRAKIKAVTWELPIIVLYKTIIKIIVF